MRRTAISGELLNNKLTRYSNSYFTIIYDFSQFQLNYTRPPDKSA